MSAHNVPRTIKVSIQCPQDYWFQGNVCLVGRWEMKLNIPRTISVKRWVLRTLRLNWQSWLFERLEFSQQNIPGNVTFRSQCPPGLSVSALIVHKTTNLCIQCPVDYWTWSASPGTTHFITQCPPDINRAGLDWTLHRHERITNDETTHRFSVGTITRLYLPDVLTQNNTWIVFSGCYSIRRKTSS